MTPTAPFRRTTSTLQGLALLALPHGGQRLARRNAWAGMSRDTALGRDRRAGEAALRAAQLRDDLPAGRHSAAGG